jgi:sugar lactone lactonase YvrE
MIATNAMSAQPECVAPTGDICGEGAVWHTSDRSVYWVDINRFLIHRFTPSNKYIRNWFFDEPVTALTVTDRDDTLAIVFGSGVILWQPQLDKRSAPIFRLESWPRVRLNDARADPRGSLWLGSMRNNVNADGSSSEAGGRDGVLYRLDPDGAVTRWCDNIGIANTLAWSPDRARFYFADTLQNIVWAYDYDIATGAISNQRSFLQNFARGLPDGSSVDAEGYLWNCRHAGGCIVRVAPSGKIDCVIEMPVQNVTTCAFGGDDARTLYITTARSDGAQHERFVGGLFALRTEVPGQPENRFAVFAAGRFGRA